VISSKDTFKNLTVNRIAFYSAGILAFVTAMLTVLLQFVMAEIKQRPDETILIFIIVFLCAFLLIRFVINRYLYRRIKLIYKSIRTSKISVPEEKIDAHGDILSEVEEDVREWAEGQAHEIQTLKTLEDYRKRFLGNVSHELKTPIFSIQGYLDTLLDGGLYDKSINERYLKRASNNVDRILTIVKDLEEISKLESGELMLEVQQFDIKELVKQVYLDLDFPANEKKISLVFKEGADKTYMVKGDREYIRRVFDNLIMNSIRYGKEGGLTKVSFYDMDKQILIEVSDDGIGIEEKHLKFLFDRFYRVDKSRSRSSGGSGLGLSIVKHIIEGHHQSINIRSTPGVGSTFGFTLNKAL
jgi:two-component system phosphate regulon sensor histidine kinase PhoR